MGQESRLEREKKNKVTINYDNNDDYQQLLPLLAGAITFISSESANQSVTNALPRSLICIPSESLSLRVSSLTGRQDQNRWVISQVQHRRRRHRRSCWFLLVRWSMVVVVQSGINMFTSGATLMDVSESRRRREVGGESASAGVFVRLRLLRWIPPGPPAQQFASQPWSLSFFFFFFPSLSFPFLPPDIHLNFSAVSL